MFEPIIHVTPIADTNKSKLEWMNSDPIDQYMNQETGGMSDWSENISEDSPFVRKINIYIKDIYIYIYIHI